MVAHVLLESNLQFGTPQQTRKQCTAAAKVAGQCNPLLGRCHNKVATQNWLSASDLCNQLIELACLHCCSVFVCSTSRCLKARNDKADCISICLRNSRFGVCWTLNSSGFASGKRCAQWNHSQRFLLLVSCFNNTTAVAFSFPVAGCTMEQTKHCAFLCQKQLALQVLSKLGFLWVENESHVFPQQNKRHWKLTQLRWLNSFSSCSTGFLLACDEFWSVWRCVLDESEAWPKGHVCNQDNLMWKLAPGVVAIVVNQVKHVTKLSLMNDRPIVLKCDQMTTFCVPPCHNCPSKCRHFESQRSGQVLQLLIWPDHSTSKQHLRIPGTEMSTPSERSSPSPHSSRLSHPCIVQLQLQRSMAASCLVASWMLTAGAAASTVCDVAELQLHTPQRQHWKKITNMAASPAPCTHSELVVFALIPKCSNFLSILGALHVIQDVLLDPSKRSKTHCRLMVSLNSICLFHATAGFFATWPAPADEPVLWASGSTATCTTQGFFMQLGIGTIVQTTALSCCCHLVLVCQWPDGRIQRLEQCAHGTGWLFGLGTALVGLKLKLYNNANLWCWISSLPQSCEGGNSPSGGQGACTRGQNAWLYRLVLFCGPVVVGIVLNTMIMTRVVWYVRSAENRTQKHRYNGSVSGSNKPKTKSQRSNNSLSSQVFWQSVHYCSVFYMTWFFPILMRTLETITGKAPAWTIIGFCIFGPLYGFLTFLVYIRPRCHQSPVSTLTWSLTQSFTRSTFLTSFKRSTTFLGSGRSSNVPGEQHTFKTQNPATKEVDTFREPTSTADLTDAELEITDRPQAAKADNNDKLLATSVVEDDNNSFAEEDQSEPLTDEMKDISAYNPSFVLMMIMSRSQLHPPNNSDDDNRRLSISSRIPSQRDSSHHQNSRLSNSSMSTRSSWIPHLRLLPSFHKRASDSMEAVVLEEEEEDEPFWEGGNNAGHPNDTDAPSDVERKCWSLVSELPSTLVGRGVVPNPKRWRKWFIACERLKTRSNILDESL